MATLKDFRDERLRKLGELKKLGVNPYPAKSNRSLTIGELLADYEKLEKNDASVIAVGRITNIRKFGKIAFVVIKDASGEIQLFLREQDFESKEPNYAESELGFNNLNLLDTGDFIEASGVVSNTQTGEKSIFTNKIRLLTKTLRPLPSVQEGFSNKEERLRRRYVDLNVNKDVFERFVRRSKFWQATREFLIKERFIEINVPVLEHTTGGADAKPFKTHMDAIDQDFYLRISHELPLKRLIGGGYERVFDIGPRFRNENYSDEHLPEHIAFESYAAYQDYEQAMELYERQMKEVALATWGKLKFENVNGFKVNLDQKWPIVRYPEIMKEKFGVDVFNPDLKQLKEILKKHKVELDGEVNTLRAMDSVWKIIRRESAGPFWLIHEPVEISPLAKVDPKDQRVTQRFHPVIAGTEMGNGYSELNDPIDQLDRFLEQEKLRAAGDEEAQMLDIDFVEMLEYGMPPATGWSYSERFFWMFEGVTAREGVPFPQLRHEIDEVTKATYPEVYSKQAVRKKGETLRPQDFSHKIIVVVNKELEPWQAANAIAHMTAIIGNELEKDKLVSGDYFVGNDDVAIPRNSQYPIIVMKGGEKDLHKLHSEVQQANLLHHVFIKEMQDTTNDEEIVKTLEKQGITDTTFYGVTLFAANDIADKLTKSFQLFK